MSQIRYFAAAADAAGTATEHVDADTLGELRDALIARHGDHFARVLQRCSILIDGRQSSDPATPTPAAATVDVLPPFAGGSV